MVFWGIPVVEEFISTEDETTSTLELFILDRISSKLFEVSESSGKLRNRARKFSNIISVVTTSSLNQIIPQRETVANVAYFKSATSKMIRT